MKTRAPLSLTYNLMPAALATLPRAIAREVTYRALDDPHRTDFMEGLFIIVEIRLAQISPHYRGGGQWDNRHV